MARPLRTTGPLLDVALCLIQADAEGRAVHGWAIMNDTKWPGPTVYGVLDRLEDCQWITGEWEDQNPKSGKPRRRLYRLTPEGLRELHDLVAERRPSALENLGHRPTTLPGRRKP